MYSRDWSSQALAPFARRRREAPYTESGVRVTPVAPRDGVTVGGPINRSTYHLIESLASAWIDGRMVLGARWLCGSGSIGVRAYHPDRLWSELFSKWADPADPENCIESTDDFVCFKCLSVRDGIQPAACVYRAYDKAGQLLYIGSTKNWERRQGQHRSKTWWWPAVKRVDVETHPTVAEAREAEALAIAAEHPRMNIAHNRAGVSA